MLSQATSMDTYWFESMASTLNTSKCVWFMSSCGLHNINLCKTPLISTLHNVGVLTISETGKRPVGQNKSERVSATSQD